MADETNNRLSAASVVVIIPALNEQDSVARVISEIPFWVRRVIVVDNGSTDATADRAREVGAHVVVEPRRGYGQACLTGCAAATDAEILVFLDADLSDYPADMGQLVEPIIDGRADMVIGSRVMGSRQRGALLPQQYIGGVLACTLIRLFWGHSYTDLGPFRAIRRAGYDALAMDDRNFGWTVQMQIRAVTSGLTILEVPVNYRRRIGKSKISGTLRGIFSAGVKIFYTIGHELISQRRTKARQAQKSGVDSAR
ncbi:MAG: glycosyltransferase family 2 protein [Phycisphaerae bacterium]